MYCFVVNAGRKLSFTTKQYKADKKIYNGLINIDASFVVCECIFLDFE